MADITVQQLRGNPTLEEIVAESDALERELFAINRQKAKLIEERRVEDIATRLSRAQQNEFIASTRRKEDSDAEVRIGEDQDCHLVEQNNIQLTRAREDEILASNRRKQDAGIALRRIGENKECDFIKAGITQKQSDLKSAIESIACQSPVQGGQEAISKKTVTQMSEEQRLVRDMDNSIREELKQLGMECHPSSDQGLESEKDALKTTPFQAPSYSSPSLVHREEHANCQELQGNIHPSRLQLLAQDLVEASSKEDLPKTTPFQAPSYPPSTIVHYGGHSNLQQLQGSVHPSRLQLLAQDSVEASSSTSNGTDSTITRPPQPSRPVLTAIPEGSGSLNALMGPSRKRKATSPPRPDDSASPFLAEKKRMSFHLNNDNTQHSMNREFQPSLQPIVKSDVTSLQSSPQSRGNTNENYNHHRASSVPTGPKLQSRTISIEDNSNKQLFPSTPTGPKLHSGTASIRGNCSNQLITGTPTGPKLLSGTVSTRDNPSNQLLPSTPTVPKLRLGAVGIPGADIRCLWGYDQDSGFFNCQSMLILHESNQVHAPVSERANGIYHTLLRPEPPRFGQFPVLVCAKTGGTYRYVGNYVFGGSRVLQDSEVDIMGAEACRALVTSQLMDVPRQGTPVVKREFYEILMKRGIVRTEREATKTTALDLAKRMKHIKLKPTFTGKPVNKMSTFANRLVFRSFTEDFYTHYFEKNPA